MEKGIGLPFSRKAILFVDTFINVRSRNKMRVAMSRAHTGHQADGVSLLTTSWLMSRMYAANAATTSDLRSKLECCPAHCVLPSPAHPGALTNSSRLLFVMATSQRLICKLACKGGLGDRSSSNAQRERVRDHICLLASPMQVSSFFTCRFGEDKDLQMTRWLWLSRY